MSGRPIASGANQGLVRADLDHGELEIAGIGGADATHDGLFGRQRRMIDLRQAVFPGELVLECAIGCVGDRERSGGQFGIWLPRRVAVTRDERAIVGELKPTVPLT